MKRGGFTLMRISGIEVILDNSWWLALSVFLLFMGYFPRERQDYPAWHYWATGAVTAVLFFLSILFHELAHSVVAVKQGVRVVSIRLLVFGGITHATSEPKTGKQEFLIAVSGPVASAAVSTVFLVIYTLFYWIQREHALAIIAESVAWANIFLTGLNLIPGFPFDGGRILRAFLWDRWNDLTRATKAVSRVGNMVALFLMLLGILQFFATRSLVLGVLFVFLGLFMKHAAAGGYQNVVLRNTLSGVPVRQVMSEDVVAVDWLLSVGEFVENYLYRYKRTDFPVFDRGEFVGMATLDGVRTIPKDLWAFKQVRDIMIPVEMGPFLNADDDAAGALDRMLGADLEHMPVIENGRLLGIVSRRDIMNLLRIKSELQS